MKKVLFTFTALCSLQAFAQNPLDKYFTGVSTFSEVATSAHGLSSPHDLDIVPSRPNEMWVLNKETNGGSVVIFWDAGKPGQAHQFRKDSHNGHFMARAVSIAMGDNDEFVSAQEIKNTASASSTFMGPALWPSDTAVFARLNQNDWVAGELLGSHIDMLHQSPYGMGVAHDHDRVYWYFDGHNGNICKYDFAAPHGVGEDDHADGKIHRYTDVTVTRKVNVPSHMVKDKTNNWLYIVDGGSNRVIRLKTSSGTVGATLTAPATGDEPLAEYKAVTGATVEVLITSGLTAPCGIDYKGDRIIVSDYATGDIYMYDVSTSTPSLVGKFITDGPGVMGVKIDKENKIWYVNNTTKKLMRIDNPNVSTSMKEFTQTADYTIYPNPASDILNIRMNDLQGSRAADISIMDATGKQIYRTSTTEQQHTVNTASWPRGTYIISLVYNSGMITEKVVLQ